MRQTKGRGFPYQDVNKRLTVLELFAGTRSIGKAFEKAGHTVFSVEWDKSFENIDLYADIGKLTKSDIISLCGGTPDVIWASPDCTTFRLPQLVTIDAKIKKQGILTLLAIMLNSVMK